MYNFRGVVKSFGNSLRCYSHHAHPDGYKVAVLGAAGGIGQPLSLLLKLQEGISHLSLYDLVNTPGVAADLSHINTEAKVTGHMGDEQLGDALKGAHVVLIPAGVPRKPGMTRDDLFNTNASIVQKLAKGVAKHCPEAHVLVISNPVNSTVPIVAETFKQAGVYDRRRLFGVSTLDILRANTFIAEAKGLNPRKVDVTVIGGHAGITILPLFSQIPQIKAADEEIEQLTHRVQFGGDEVVKAKAGTGSATLSMAFAGARFAQSLLQALQGKSGISECAFVENDMAPTSFFASRVELGKEGIKKILPMGRLSEIEKKKLDELVPELRTSIQKGIDFAKKI